MPGNLSFDDLKKSVKAGTIDTVVVAMVDMQGRLVGKRFQAEYFVGGAHEETHACNYLLANDIDMEPVPGYAAASWDKGYGDFVLKPDMTTLRVTPWLEGTALVLADVLDHHHHDLAHSPRAMLKAQVTRLKKQKMRAYLASELEFYLFDESYPERDTKAFHRTEDRRHLYRGLPHPPDHQGRRHHARDTARVCRAPASRWKIRRASGGRARKR